MRQVWSSSSILSSPIQLILVFFLLHGWLKMDCKFKVYDLMWKKKNYGHLLALFLFCAKQMVNDRDHKSVTMCFLVAFSKAFLNVHFNNVTPQRHFWQLIIMQTRKFTWKSPWITSRHFWCILYAYCKGNAKHLFFSCLVFYCLIFANNIQHLAGWHCWFGHFDWIKTIQWILHIKC